MRLPTLLAVLLLPSFLSAQTASYALFGTGCSTQLTANGLPQIGKSFTVVYNGPSFCNATVCAQPVLLTGLSNTQWGSIKLPIQPSFAIGGCGLLVSIEFMAPIAPGKKSLDIPIPNDGRLIGLRFYHQWMTLMTATSSATTVFFSNGGIMTVGT